jgi:hypothetical protein
MQAATLARRTDFKTRLRGFGERCTPNEVATVFKAWLGEIWRCAPLFGDEKARRGAR